MTPHSILLPAVLASLGSPQLGTTPLLGTPLLGGILVPLLGRVSDIWYLLYLVVVVSLVYSATRYESMRHIVGGATRFGVWICGLVAVIFGALYWLTSSL